MLNIDPHAHEAIDCGTTHLVLTHDLMWVVWHLSFKVNFPAHASLMER